MKENYTLTDFETLRTIKHALREITKLLDASGKVYPDALEAREVKHEVSVLLSELKVHGLLPE